MANATRLLDPGWPIQVKRKAISTSCIRIKTAVSSVYLVELDSQLGEILFGIQLQRLTLWKQYLLSIALTMVTSSTTQIVVWIILLCNTKTVNYMGQQITTPYVVPISLRLNQVIAKDSPTLDLTDHFIRYNTAIQVRKRKKLCFTAHPLPFYLMANHLQHHLKNVQPSLQLVPQAPSMSALY